MIEHIPVTENSQIVSNYQYFYQEVEKLTDQEIKGMYDAIMKLQIVNVSLFPDKGDDPQLIFESLNSTGLQLGEADKIRNFVLMNLPSKTQERFYRKYWEQLENNVGRGILTGLSDIFWQ